MTDAQAAEALDQDMIDVEFEGHTYHLDRNALTLDMLELDENGFVLKFVRSWMGAEQWAEYRERHPMATTLGKFRDAVLVAAGNSEASPAS